MIPNLNVGLIHYPVLNKHREMVTTSVTLFDIHDIARSSATFGVNEYLIINPSLYQKKVVDRLIHFWKQGYGKEYNDNRAAAITKVQFFFTLEEGIQYLTGSYQKKPLIIGTSAKNYSQYPGITFPELKETLQQEPVLLLLGTGWGLSDEVLQGCNRLLEPIPGKGDYNHLSVRAAAAIMLYKLMNE
ncbi:RNA methyltransferase [bacterium]|nr:RNA methyltransferase [bacterium]